MPRLFTALEIPREAALSLSLLRGGLPGARWIDVENYHITLRFIGDVEGHVADEVANALDRVRRSSFSLTLSGVGAFGGKKPHSVWAGVSASPDLHATAHTPRERRQSAPLSALFPSGLSQRSALCEALRVGAQPPGVDELDDNLSPSA